MDSITHIAIGACIGDLFLGKKIGKKAMLYGAIAASLPDIDFVASFWLDTTQDLLAHRGFTHSILFAVLFVTASAFFFRHHHRVENIPVRTWLIFLGTEIASHLFLDAFNAYGIGWFEPFSHRRISFNVIFVADPLFSIWPAMAAVVLLVLRMNSHGRRRWSVFGLTGCSLYLIYCIAHKITINRAAALALQHQHIPYQRYFTTPTPFNNWLWYAVAETDSGFQIGYRSVYDRNPQIPFRYFPKNKFLLLSLNHPENLQRLIQFSQGYYIVDTAAEGLVFNDLRFGQMMGWQHPDAGFVFHYYLQDSTANDLVVQRGRFSHWNWQAVRFMMHRIRGN